MYKFAYTRKATLTVNPPPARADTGVAAVVASTVSLAKRGGEVGAGEVGAAGEGVEAVPFPVMTASDGVPLPDAVQASMGAMARVGPVHACVCVCVAR